MIILGVILLILGSLVPLDARAKQALIVVGIVLLVVGALVMLFGWTGYGPRWGWY
jgi:hypothetical protein